MGVLHLSGLSKRFGATRALDGVTLTIRPGEVHAVIGENGAGKSTLMNVVAGLVRPDAGAMTLDGRPYAPASPLDGRRQGIALIHQELSLCPHLTVAENILMGREPARWGWIDREAARRQALEILAGFQHPEIHPDRRAGALPIAARQVVEICRALAARARILLMDEPTSSLPRADVDRLFALIRRLRGEGLALVYISHFLEEIREVADVCTVLRDGRSIATTPLGQVGDEELIAQMVGREVDRLFPDRSDREPGPVLLEVRDLAAPPAVERASFTVHRGEILGVAGLVGSGRTEMVRALMGLLRAAGGRVALPAGARPAGDARPWRRIEEGVGYLSEDRTGEGLALPLSIADNITLTRLSACATRGWLHVARQRRQAEAWIGRLRVRARGAAQPVKTLSGGNQQKVALARLLHQDADLLLLDEPTRGVDIGSKAEIYEIIADCAARGRAVLLVSSYLPELFGLCDRVAVMSRGRLSEARPVGAWTPETIMEAAIGGAQG